MSKAKPWLLLAMVFFAGIAVGVVGTRMVARKAFTEARGNPDWLRQRFERELITELNLNSEQQTQLRAILADTQAQLKSLRTDFQPRLQEIFRNNEKRIAETLTPEQRDRFEKYVKEKKLLWRPPQMPGERMPQRIRPQESR